MTIMAASIVVDKHVGLWNNSWKLFCWDNKHQDKGKELNENFKTIYNHKAYPHWNTFSMQDHISLSFPNSSTKHMSL